MIVGTLGFHLPPQMSFIENDDVIQAFSPYGPNNSLDVRVLPRRAASRKHFFDTETFHAAAESRPADAVPVAYNAGGPMPVGQQNQHERGFW
jgi:hypothetical protein